MDLKSFHNSKGLFFNCFFFYVFDVSNDPSLYIVKKAFKIFEKGYYSF